MVASPSRRPRRRPAVVSCWIFIDDDVGADVGQRRSGRDPPLSVSTDLPWQRHERPRVGHGEVVDLPLSGARSTAARLGQRSTGWRGPWTLPDMSSTCVSSALGLRAARGGAARRGGRGWRWRTRPECRPAVTTCTRSRRREPGRAQDHGRSAGRRDLAGGRGVGGGGEVEARSPLFESPGFERTLGDARRVEVERCIRVAARRAGPPGSGVSQRCCSALRGFSGSSLAGSRTEAGDGRRCRFWGSARFRPAPQVSASSAGE